MFRSTIAIKWLLYGLILHVHTYSCEGGFPISKSATLSGLVPRHPTGNDWSESKTPLSTRESIGLQEMLSDLDQRARYKLCVFLCV